MQGQDPRHEGVEHTVRVTAATLYEAVALGLKAVGANEWVEGIAQGQNKVTISVQNIAVDHAVQLKDFNRWLERKGGSPAEMSTRRRIREVLRLPHFLLCSSRLPYGRVSCVARVQLPLLMRWRTIHSLCRILPPLSAAPSPTTASWKNWVAEEWV
jgi:hypothetical protein